ncbi:MAG: EutN/CcmL family microcompartment protein [Gloeomargarita sp. SKYG116]|nr:EutN/CcmL family microcompartment protein [Gloeomargarita sp. SKYG116]MCS7226416.1 EutN/CcmL family microcompartment protein [Gloeomargarita sp. SKYB31]MDW8401265.1 EutN/CcmL family microcompartment protein [Gloeomargarita sp. SKYGB_i_bin116]
MRIARVAGTVVSTQKEPTLQGVKFLLVQLVDIHGQMTPEYQVAADRVGAGVDEWVLVCEGSSARKIDRGEDLPVDAAVIGIIDTVTVEGQLLYSKRAQARS